MACISPKVGAFILHSGLYRDIAFYLTTILAGVIRLVRIYRVVMVGAASCGLSDNNSGVTGSSAGNGSGVSLDFLASDRAYFGRWE